jgi:transketolase
MLKDRQKQLVTEKARDIRISIIEMLLVAGSGHTAGPLGMSDVFAYLYFHFLRHDVKKPEWPMRDRFVLSNGHICPVLYSTLAHAGYFPVPELLTLRKFGSRLQGHPHRQFFPYTETSSGPLGSGLSQTIGMALAGRIDARAGGVGDERRYVCAMGDGELNEGQNWEAFMLAGREKLSNLIAIVDRNDIQIDGFTHDVMPLEPLRQKFEAFNWHVVSIDGNDIDAIDRAFTEATIVTDKPVMIIAKTIPGKGVSGFEGKFEWHGKTPNKEQAERAIAELKAHN